ncbi:MAG TPA: NAD-dependent epimerase/dehydratase family protein [Solirubrobacteraceae bacterium]|nr:NAD-dependent epimerase/dehydratase family protein [Solirubrobacteraceae bacterium]
MPRSSGITVAVTGATGELGRPFVRALEQSAEVRRVRAMARRPFDPGRLGWRKTDYTQGDILEGADVGRLMAGADVVAHLAFIVVKASARSYQINIEGSRNVFEAVAAARVPRLVYTSSLAAYGYHAHAGLLTEDTPTRGTERHAYSRQKADVERVLGEALAGSDTQAYVFRPCIVAGPEAPALLDAMPYLSAEHALPGWALRALRRVPGLRPVLPVHGVPFQLVHHDDVAAALLAGVLARGEPGVYNLAGPGEVHWSDVARELGWHAVPVPRQAVDVSASLLGRIPGLDVQAGWLEAMRVPMLMDCTRARRELGWQPAYDGLQTLRELVAAYARRP